MMIIDNLEHHRLPSIPPDMANYPQPEQQLWELVQKCWNFEPSQRPTARCLREGIRGIIAMNY